MHVLLKNFASFDREQEQSETFRVCERHLRIVFKSAKYDAKETCYSY